LSCFIAGIGGGLAALAGWALARLVVRAIREQLEFNKHWYDK